MYDILHSELKIRILDTSQWNKNCKKINHIQYDKNIEFAL